MAKEKKETSETETTSADKPKIGVLKTATTWNGKVLKAGTPAPKELLDWVKSVEKKTGKTVSDYVVD
jgi:hypothetical protein